jgi:hypothetical protein
LWMFTRCSWEVSTHAQLRSSQETESMCMISEQKLQMRSRAVQGHRRGSTAAECSRCRAAALSPALRAAWTCRYSRKPPWQLGQSRDTSPYDLQLAMMMPKARMAWRFPWVSGASAPVGFLRWSGRTKPDCFGFGRYAARNRGSVNKRCSYVSSHHVASLA